LSKDCADPPDLSPVAQATAESAQIARDIAAEELAFRRQQYEEAKPRIERFQQMAEDVALQQLGLAKAQEQRAAEQYARYNQLYAPVELQSMLDSLGIMSLSPEEARQALADLTPAGLGVDSSYQQGVLDTILRSQQAEVQKAKDAASAAQAASQAQAERTLARRGLDPTRMTTFAASLAREGALARTQAANQARQGAIQQGITRRAGFASLGKGLPNVAGQTVQTSTQAGGTAVQSGKAGANAQLPFSEFVAGGYGSRREAEKLAMEGALGYGNLLADVYRTQASTYEDPLGAILGAGARLGSAFLLKP